MCSQKIVTNGNTRPHLDIVTNILPDKVPTPMTRVSTIVSKVIVGPNNDIPLAILLFTSV